MDQYISSETQANLSKYSQNLFRFCQIESALARSSTDLNQLMADLYVSQRTDALKALSDILLMGFMQHSAHSLYVASWNKMPQGSAPASMTNRLDAHTLETLKEIGLDDIHIGMVREHNRSMSAIVEGIINFEKVYRSLTLQMDLLSNIHGSEFDRALVNFMDEEFDGIPSVAYLTALSRIDKRKAAPESFVHRFGAIPAGYKFVLNSNNAFSKLEKQ